MIKNLYDLLQILLKQNSKTHIKKQKLLIYDVYLKKYVNADELLIPSPTKDSLESIQSWKNSRDILVFHLLLKKFINPRLDLLSPAGVSVNDLSKVLDPSKIHDYRSASTLKGFWGKGSGSKIHHVPALPSTGNAGGETLENSVGWAGQVTVKPESNPRPEHGIASSVLGPGDNYDRLSSNSTKDQSATEKGQSKRYDTNSTRNGALLYEGNLEGKKKGRPKSAKSLKSEGSAVVQNESKSNLRSKKLNNNNNSISKKSSDIQTNDKPHGISNDTNKKEEVKIKPPKKDTGTFFKKICSQMFLVGKFGRGESRKTYNEVANLQGKDTLSKEAKPSNKNYQNEKHIVKNNTSDRNLEKNLKECHKVLDNLMNSSKTEVKNKNNDISNWGKNKSVYKNSEKIQDTVTNLKTESPFQKGKYENMKVLNNDNISKNKVKQNGCLTNTSGKVETSMKNKRLDSTNIGVRTITNNESKSTKTEQAIKKNTYNSYKESNSTLSNTTTTDLENAMGKPDVNIRNSGDNIRKSEIKNKQVDSSKTDGRTVIHNEINPTRKEQANPLIPNELSPKIDFKNSTSTTNQTDTKLKSEELKSIKPSNLTNATSITNKTDSKPSNDMAESTKTGSSTLINEKSQPTSKKQVNAMDSKSNPKKDSESSDLNDFQNEVSQDKFQPKKIKSLENTNFNFTSAPIQFNPIKSVYTIENKIATVINEPFLKTESKLPNLKNTTSITNKTDRKLKNGMPESTKTRSITVINDKSQSTRKESINTTENRLDQNKDSKPSDLNNYQNEMTSQDKFQPREIKSLENLNFNFKMNKLKPHTINIQPLKKGESFTNINNYEKGDSLVNDEKRLNKQTTASNTGTFEKVSFNSKNSNTEIKTQNINIPMLKKDENSSLKNATDCTKDSSIPQKKVVLQMDGEDWDGKSNTIKSYHVEPKSTEKLQSISAQGRYVDNLALEGDLNQYNIVNYKGFKVASSKSNTQVTSKKPEESSTLQNDIKRSSSQSNVTEQTLENPKRLYKFTKIKGSVTKSKSNIPNDKELVNKSLINDKGRDLLKNSEKHSEVKKAKDQEIEKNNLLSRKITKVQNMEHRNEKIPEIKTAKDQEITKTNVLSSKAHAMEHTNNGNKQLTSDKIIMTNSVTNVENVMEENKLKSSSAKEKKKCEKIEETSKSLASGDKKRNDLTVESKPTHRIKYSINRRKSIKPITFKYVMKKTRKNRTLKDKNKTNSIDDKMQKENTNSKGNTKISQSDNKTRLNKQPQRSKSNPVLSENAKFYNRKQENKKHNIKSKSVETLLPSEKVQSSKQTSLKRDTKTASYKRIPIPIPKNTVLKSNSTNAKVLSSSIKKYQSKIKYFLNAKLQISNRHINRGGKEMVKSISKTQNTVSKGNVIIKGPFSLENKPNLHKDPSKIKNNISNTKLSSKVVTKKRKGHRSGKTKQNKIKVFGKKANLRKYASTSFKNINLNKQPTQVSDYKNESSQINKIIISSKPSTCSGANEKQTNSNYSPLQNGQDSANNKMSRILDQKNPGHKCKTSVSKTPKKIIKNKSSPELPVQSKDNNNTKKKQFNINSDLKEVHTKKLSISKRNKSSEGNLFLEQQNMSRKTSLRALKTPRNQSESRSYSIIRPNILKKTDILDDNRSKQKNASSNSVHKKGQIKKKFSLNDVGLNKKEVTNNKVEISPNADKLPVTKDKTAGTNLKNKGSSKDNLLILPQIKKDATQKLESLKKYIKENVGSQKINTEIKNKDEEIYYVVNHNQLDSVASKSKTSSGNLREESIISNSKASVKDSKSKSKQTIFDSKQSKKRKNTYSSLQRNINISTNIKNDKNKIMQPEKKQDTSSLKMTKDKLKKSENTTLDGSKVSGKKEQLSKKKSKLTVLNSTQHGAHTPKAALNIANTEGKIQNMVNNIKKTVNTPKTYSGRNTPNVLHSIRQTVNTLTAGVKEPRDEIGKLTIPKTTKQAVSAHTKEHTEQISERSTQKVFNSIKQTKNIPSDHGGKEPCSGRSTSKVLNSIKHTENTKKNNKDLHSGRNTPAKLNNTNNTCKTPEGLKEPSRGKSAPNVLNSTKQNDNILKDQRSGRNTPAMLIRTKQIENTPKKDIDNPRTERNSSKQIINTKKMVNTTKETHKEPKSSERNKLVELSSLKTDKIINKNQVNTILSKVLSKGTLNRSSVSSNTDKINATGKPYYCNAEGNIKSEKMSNFSHTENINKNSLKSSMKSKSMGKEKINIKNIDSEIKNQTSVSTGSKKEFPHTPSKMYSSGKNKILPNYKVTAENSNFKSIGILKNKTDQIHNVNSSVYNKKINDEENKTFAIQDKKGPSKIPRKTISETHLPAKTATNLLKANSKTNNNPNKSFHNLNTEQPNAVQGNFSTIAKNLTWCVTNQSKPSEFKTNFNKDMFGGHMSETIFGKVIRKEENLNRGIINNDNNLSTHLQDDIKHNTKVSMLKHDVLKKEENTKIHESQSKRLGVSPEIARKLSPLKALSKKTKSTLLKSGLISGNETICSHKGKDKKASSETQYVNNRILDNKQDDLLIRTGSKNNIEKQNDTIKSTRTKRDLNESNKSNVISHNGRSEILKLDLGNNKTESSAKTSEQDKQVKRSNQTGKEENQNLLQKSKINTKRKAKNEKSLDITCKNKTTSSSVQLPARKGLEDSRLKKLSDNFSSQNTEWLNEFSDKYPPAEQKEKIIVDQVGTKNTKEKSIKNPTVSIESKTKMNTLKQNYLTNLKDIAIKKSGQKSDVEIKSTKGGSQLKNNQNDKAPFVDHHKESSMKEKRKKE